MKITRTILFCFLLVILFSSCRVWNKVFPVKYGCPTNGKNVGAEQLLNGDPKTMKAVRKAKKFKA